MGKTLRDADIAKALREIKQGHKTAITITDGTARGAGRLALIVKPERAEWYAIQYVAGKRRLEKIGAYPSLSLADARERFRSASPSSAETKATVGELFNAYTDTLTGRASHEQAIRLLGISANVIGHSKPAGRVRPYDIISVIKPIYARDKHAYAEKYRMFLSAAFQWGMRSAHDYRVENLRDWGIKANPCDSIPKDRNAGGVRSRWLSVDEFAALFKFVAAHSRTSKPVKNAILLMLLTGQRVNEVLQISPSMWNNRERLLVWETTKNGKPHVLPVCDQAARILDNMDFKWGKTCDDTLLAWHQRYMRRTGTPHYCNRDIRRTWKTLAGFAGINKELRDRMQNHTIYGVSARVYDRYEYLDEKREAAKKWGDWLEKGGIRAPPIS